MPPFRVVRRALDSPTRLRALIACLALVALGACPTTAVAGDASPSTSEREFTRLLNAERVAHGMNRVEISPALTAIADEYVLLNERLGGITHARDAPFTALANAVGCGKWLGPVLGIAYPSYPNVRTVLDGWLTSPGHRAVVLDPEITHIGVGLRAGHAVAFGMVCARNAANTSGDYGDPRPGAPPPPSPRPLPAPSPSRPSTPGAAPEAFGLRSLRTGARGRKIRVRLRVATGSARLRLVARRRGRVARGRWVLLKARKRSYLLAVKVPNSGRWRIYLSSRAGAIALGRVRVRG
jgi:uncharacterized protein YkwD